MPVTFTTLWEHYRGWLLLESDCKAGTVTVYRRICWDFAIPHTGYLALLPKPKPWWKASDDDLRSFVNQPLLSGPRRGQQPSARYRASRISAVKGMYAFAYGRGWIARDPMALVRSPKIGLEQPRSFEPEELAAILDAAERATDDDRLYPMVWVAYAGVLRCHAIAALRLEDFHPRPRPGRLLVVRKRLPGRHWVPLHTAAREALDRYLAGRTREGRALLPGDPLFGNLRWPHQPLRPARVGELFHGLIRDRAGLPRGSAHWLRHTGATTACEEGHGENVEHVRELLDHRDSATTRRYIQGVEWRVRERAVDLILDPRRPTTRRA